MFVSVGGGGGGGGGGVVACVHVCEYMRMLFLWECARCVCVCVYVVLWYMCM